MATNNKSGDRKMSILNRLKTTKKENHFRNDKDVEQFILNSKVGDLFSFLHHKMITDEKPVKVGITWENVMYTITCESVESCQQAEEKFKESVMNDKNE